jgi:ABC-type transport system involved in multi-copper enzyme maturation permease subunit
VSAVLTIARATVREASRKKLVVALALITVVGIALTGFGFWRLTVLARQIDRGAPRLGVTELKTVTSQLLIVAMFAFSFVLALSTVFMAAPSIAGELESGVAAAVLTRPIRRLQFLAGKWLGLAVLTAGYVVVASGLEFLVVGAVTGYRPPHPLQFMAFLSAEALVTLTLTTLLSTRMSPVTGGVVALGGFMLAWMGGIAVALGAALDNHGVATVGTVTRLIMPSDGLWRGAVYSLEPAAWIAGILGSGRAQAAANPFFAPTGPPVAYLLWVAVWALAVFSAASWSFRRREI